MSTHVSVLEDEIFELNKRVRELEDEVKTAKIDGEIEALQGVKQLLTDLKAPLCIDSALESAIHKMRKLRG